MQEENEVRTSQQPELDFQAEFPAESKNSNGGVLAPGKAPAVVPVIQATIATGVSKKAA